MDVVVIPKGLTVRTGKDVQSRVTHPVEQCTFTGHNGYRALCAVRHTQGALRTFTRAYSNHIRL
jgi:hypothetical protein